MKRAFGSTLVVALVATTISTQTPAGTSAGTPVTNRTLVDQAEMNAIDVAVDVKNLRLARGFFADEIRVDFSSVAGGAPGATPSDALIEGASAILTSKKSSFHPRGIRNTMGR